MSFWTAVVVIVAILAGTIISTSKHKAKNNNADNDKTNELVQSGKGDGPYANLRPDAGGSGLCCGCGAGARRNQAG